MKKIIKKQILNTKMPKFWQLFTVLHAVSLGLVFFFANDFWANIFRPILGLLICVGVAVGIWQQELKSKLWGLLISGIIFFELSIILQSLIYFGFPINDMSPFWIKQIGIVLSTSFTIGVILLIEKRFKLKGLAVDFSLVVMSIFCFLFIVNPEYLNTFLFEFTITQQIYLSNIIIGILLVTIGTFHLFLSKKFELKDIILFTIISFFTLHIILEMIMTFPSVENKQLISRTSWFFYQILGTLTIFYTYLEKLKFNISQHSASKSGQLFMWSASILAILVVPIAVLLHWSMERHSTFYLVAGLSSLTLGSIVIWRFIIITNNSNLQRNQLLAITHTDELTGVLNYRGCAEKYLISPHNNSLVIAMNIEDFKSINDLYGRDFGDEVLISLAKRLTQLKNIMMVARTGADTFMTVFQTPADKIQLQLKTIQEELGVWDTVARQRIAVPLTFGASHSIEVINPEILSMQAEKALKVARDKHISTYLYTDEVSKKLVPRHELRGILQQALDLNFLPVHFQPIYNLEDGSLKALELLIRLQSKEHGLLLPGQFLEQAQAYGLLTPLTKVCVHMIAKSFNELPKVTININLPSYMLDNPRILNEFLDCFKEKLLPPERFCIEVMEDEDIPAEHLLSSVKLLKKEGFSIAMDDFGTGYSSLSRLSMLPFDTVKIDRSLLLSASAGNKAILESTITLIKRLGISTVVEGVETLEQLALIQLLGADSVQGFLLSKPVDIHKATKLPLNAANIIPEF